jgi:DNA-binding HxlR family transcriptional regulator
VPLLFESQFVGGDPDLASTVGTTANLSFADNPLATGEWDVLPVEYGAFGTTGPPSETATTSASVVTSPFDTNVSSPTGDLESDSANPATSLGSFAPITVGPGQTATIPITITPSGASGTTVTGTLYLDDTAYFEFGSIQDAVVNYPQADEVAALPYQYTIKYRPCGGAPWRPIHPAMWPPRGPPRDAPSLQFVKSCAKMGNLMVSNDTCPVCRTAEIVCGKWTLLVIRDLAEGRSRFCELERSLAGISPRTLSLRLRAREEEGIVERQTFPEVPPRVEYVLTAKGRALVPLIESMRTYGREWLGCDVLGADDDTDAGVGADRQPVATAA